MKDVNQIIQGIVILTIGVGLLFTWKEFAFQITKYSIKYTRFSEVFVKYGFYFIAIIFIAGGILLITRFFRS